MRLVCPNCGAQYEVDDRVMPEGGRDVQCSACGHAWFQRGHGAMAHDDAITEAEASVEPVATETDTTPEAEPATDEQHAPLQSAADPELAPSDDEPTEQPAPIATPPKRDLSPDVRSILNEEAQRELEVRHSEKEQLETQTEMGLEDVDPEEAQRQSIRERMARLRGADDEFETTGALSEGRGRDLLPDIEEINSTLDASHEVADETHVAEAESVAAPNGFRRGFTAMIVLAILLLLLYIYAPALSDTLPQIKPAADQYVAAVDQIRNTLNTAMEQAIQAMKGLTGDAG